MKIKELYQRCFEWVSDLDCIEEISDNEFCRGLIVGIIAGVAILLIIRFIIWLCFRKKACSNIRIDNPSGTVTVNAGAITSVLKRAAASLECLNISRIKIFRKRKGFDIWIKAKMDPAKGSAPQLMEKVAAIVRNEMKNIFGVENIRDVKLVISGCSADSDPEDDSEDIFKDDDREEQIISLKNTPENDKKDE